MSAGFGGITEWDGGNAFYGGPLDIVWINSIVQVVNILGVPLEIQLTDESAPSVSYSSENILIKIPKSISGGGVTLPPYPSSNGQYALRVTVSLGVGTLDWFPIGGCG